VANETKKHTDKSQKRPKTIHDDQNIPKQFPPNTREKIKDNIQTKRKIQKKADRLPARLRKNSMLKDHTQTPRSL